MRRDDHHPPTPWRETLVTFGGDGRLTGTFCRPADPGPAPGAPTLLLFNAGVIPRIGPHRFNVKLARRIAAAGFASLRFDLSGQGDSRPADGGLDFTSQSVSDLLDAVDTASRLAPGAGVAIFGICSGAVLGYDAALRDNRIVGCAMFDPYMYPTPKTHAIRMLARYRSEGPKVVAAWLRRRLPSGRSSTPSAGGTGGVGGIGLGLVRPPKREFAAGLRRLVDRGTALLLLHSGSAFYVYNYAGQFADGFRRFGLHRRVATEFVPNIDHTVTRLDAQQALIDMLVDWLERSFTAEGTAPSDAAASEHLDAHR
jgi:hypothetical protein